MKAIEIKRFGAPEVLRAGRAARPAAGAGELLIRVAASGVNRPDVLQRKGLYPVPPGASDLPGLEVAGEIVAGDAEAMAAAGFKVGDRVCALVAGGGYAQLCVAPVGQCLPVPKGLSDVEAASAARDLLHRLDATCSTARGCKPGETLLVQGGSSGIGVTAIQLAKALGATRHRHRRQRRQVRGLPEARRRPRDQLQDAGLRRRGQAHHRRQRRRRGARHGGRRLRRARGASAWPKTAASSSSRCRAASRASSTPACVLRRRLTITGSTLRPRPVAFKAAIARGAARARSGRCSRAARSSR